MVRWGAMRSLLLGVVVLFSSLPGCQPRPEEPPPRADAPCGEKAEYVARQCGRRYVDGANVRECQSRADRAFLECMYERHGVVVQPAHLEQP